MTDSSPLVSIGLPVFNGMPYLPAALTSLRQQKHERLEIVICDNASTDATEDFCRSVAQNDSRVVYHRFNANIGSAANFRRSLELSSADYFAWAAHDDSYHPDFVSTCLAALQEHPDAAMCTPAHRMVSLDGRIVNIVREPPGLSSEDLATRLRAHLCRVGWYTNYGVGRRSIMLAAPPPMPLFGWDVIYIWLLLMSNRIIVIDEPLTDYLVAKPRSVDAILAEITGESKVARRPATGLRHSLRDCLAQLPLDPASEGVAIRTLNQWTRSSHFRHLVALDILVEAVRMRDRDAKCRAAALFVLMGAVSPRAAGTILREHVRRGFRRATGV
jgi:glycosyltransferase involved in cell wall biosynthesis